MPKKSAGLLVYRRTQKRIEVLLVHPGGPFWAKKDLGAWSIPKGEYEGDNDPLEAARREFHEETGCSIDGVFCALTPIKQEGGKTVTSFSVEGDCDVSALHSNTFTMEWPPRSGKQQEFPEVDRACWFTLEEARQKILRSQVALLDEFMGTI